ncbi:membrane-bound lytic murein transglycosylase D [Sphaerotilus hippei]|uniref:Membrane-bound lytic murein transglycosylase D n=1 Tax=Sphaerotilus hippei TaxID=744406 RepID=A0A318H3H8_9BURK|nr:transglycosylase SLT domain-containing protein [Sphaerotilus hippei]PXW97974.1 membrane-bound lytic murein transglycosylase D [Sphaerotilus hippei]
MTSALRSAPPARLRPITAALGILVLTLTGCASTPSTFAELEAPPALTTVAHAGQAAADPVAAAPAGRPEMGDAEAVASTPGAVATGVPAAVAAPIETLVVTDPLEPKEEIRFDDQKAREDLWHRVRGGFGMTDIDSPLVGDHENWYANRPDYVQRMTTRGSLYLFHIVEEVQKRRMPTELALLPFIESAFNPGAMSSAKASGMWQFMPMTGRDFDLKQNIFRDDRRDVLASTRAALDYLARLHRQFGDWHLALAAYNWGEGNVGKAIARNQRAGLPTDYLSLSMPAETRNYVPKLLAVKNIVSRPAEFGLNLPPLQNHPYFVSVPIERDIDVDLAARLAGISLDEFKTLNPQMNKPVILAAGTPQVLLPYDNASAFVSRLKQHRGTLASWTAWVVPSTMRPADAARTVGMSEAALREINRVPPKMLVKSGSTLLVPRSAHREQDVPEHVADNAQMALAPDLPPLKRVAIKARKGDTMASLARRYRVGANQLAEWNRMSLGSRLSSGQSLVMFQPAKATKVGRPTAAERDDDRPAGRIGSKSERKRSAKAEKADKGDKRRGAVSVALKAGKDKNKATASARSTPAKPVRVATARVAQAR